MKKIVVEGHRGYAAKYPENTMISYKAAMELGVDAIEFDVWLTKDKVPVLMHDGNTMRTCGKDHFIGDLTFDELRELEPAYTEKFGGNSSVRVLKCPLLKNFSSTAPKTTRILYSALR